LLIETSLDLNADNPTVSFYGTKVPGREVKLEGPYTSNVRPAPPPRHILDPKKPKGYVNQTDWAYPGMHVVLRRVLQDASGTRTDEFVSDYTPWSAVYIEGPKDDPPSAADPAGAPTPPPATA